MVDLNWKAPKTFWAVCVALEDFEIEEAPGAKAELHVAKALASLRTVLPQIET